MSEVHIHLHFSEGKIMSVLNQILDRIASSEAKADAESAEVKAALDSLKSEIADLKSQVNEGVDVEVVKAALDRLDSKIDGIYTPEAPPAPPAGPGE